VASERFDGMFGPETITWRVNREAVLLVGGGRALLLQVAHPLVAAGVVQHSDFERDPLGRLYRTIDVTTKIVFGDARASAEAAERLRQVHSRVRGRTGHGTSYAAKDPDLLLWVWATLVDTSLLVYRRYVADLERAEIERYYREQTRFALATGIPKGHWPPDYAAFRDYFEASISNLRPSEDSHRIADSILRPTPLALRPLGPVVRLTTIGLLPDLVRRRLGLQWGERRERLFSASSATIRNLMPLLPGFAREFPGARQAKERIAA
jgi:uncharacterized protein (DUF2236 family)